VAELLPFAGRGGRAGHTELQLVGGKGVRPRGDAARCHRREQLQSVILVPIAELAGLAGKDTSRAELAGAAQRSELPRQVGAAVRVKRRRSPVRQSEHLWPRPAEMASPAPAQLKSVVGDLNHEGLSPSCPSSSVCPRACRARRRGTAGDLHDCI
jgi:hypothetical protein